MPLRHEQAILVFAKYPTPGRVKTRLAATLGADQAAQIYRQLVAHVFARLPTDADVLVFFDPPEQEREIATWLGEFRADLTFFPQASGDLGARLENAFSIAFGCGYARAAVIGTDCVELQPATFAEAWRALGEDEVAVGPTDDGGYYLLALRAQQPAVFQGIAWSTSEVIQQTLARAAEAGLSVHLLPQLADVDTEDDWLRAQSRLQS